MKQKKKLMMITATIFFLLGSFLFITPNYIEIPYLTNVNGYTQHLDLNWNYNITFPAQIWVYNAIIREDDTIETVLTTAGVYDYVEYVFHYDEEHDDWDSWWRGERWNSLENFVPFEEYMIHTTQPCSMFIPYDYDIDEPDPDIPTQVTCYKCINDELLQQQYEDECPSGWYLADDIPDGYCPNAVLPPVVIEQGPNTIAIVLGLFCILMGFWSGFTAFKKPKKKQKT